MLLFEYIREISWKFTKSLKKSRALDKIFSCKSIKESKSFWNKKNTDIFTKGFRLWKNSSKTNKYKCCFKFVLKVINFQSGHSNLLIEHLKKKVEEQKSEIKELSERYIFIKLILLYWISDNFNLINGFLQYHGKLSSHKFKMRF